MLNDFNFYQASKLIKSFLDDGLIDEKTFTRLMRMACERYKPELKSLYK